MTSIEDYAQQQLQEDAVCRGFPLSWTLEQAESGAVAIAIRFGILQKWHGKESGWSQNWPPGWFSEARVWVQKKPSEEQKKKGQPGDLNEGAIKNLGACGLWDGDWDKLEQPPPRIYVHLDIGGEEYEGRVRHRVNWINPDAPEPKPRGAFAPVDRDLLHSLRARHQAKTRAMAAPGAGGGGGRAIASPGAPGGAGAPGAQPQVAPGGAAPHGPSGAPPLPPPAGATGSPPPVPSAAPGAAPGVSQAPPPPPPGGSVPGGTPGGPPQPPQWGGPPSQPAIPPDTRPPGAPGAPGPPGAPQGPADQPAWVPGGAGGAGEAGFAAGVDGEADDLLDPGAPPF